MKITAKKTVINRLEQLDFFSPNIIALWAHVTDAPEVNKIKVFKNGIFQVSKTIKPIGGQTAPIKILGLKLEWKEPQKKQKKT